MKKIQWSNKNHVVFRLMLTIIVSVSIMVIPTIATHIGEDISEMKLEKDIGIAKTEIGDIKPSHMTEMISSPLLSESSDEIVDVYINMKHNSALALILPHIKTIVDYDKPNCILVAKVSKNNLKILAELQDVSAISPVIPPITYMGKYTTEGDGILLSDQVRNKYGLTGNGLKIGIISDGVDHIKDAQKTGDLPTNVNVLSNTHGGDEGTAMLEIVYDIAPGANLYFHDCGSNKVAFNKAIDNLANSGCTIICDDIGWLTEPYFEDGIVAKHVSNTISTKNIIYITSAGNSATRHFQGDFYTRGDDFMDFSYGMSTTQNLYAQLSRGGTFTVVLQWDDKFGESANNYDLYLYNTKTGGIIASSETTQNGNGDPIEALVVSNYGNTIDIGIAVKKKAGVAKTLEIYGYNSPMYTNNRIASDSVFGQAAVNGAVVVGAIYAKDPGYDTIESYSSQGVVTIRYPQETRYKPDICGIDGVSISGVGFTKPFYGTSAAAPHIAAICALAWSGSPTSSPYTITQALYNSAIDLGIYGKDPVFGYGRANTLELIKRLNINPATPTPTPTKTIIPTRTPIPTRTIPSIPTKTITPTVTKTPFITPTQTHTPSPTITPKPTLTKPTAPVPTTKNPTVVPTLTKPTPRPTWPWW
jgi:hypothetical protein